MSHPAALIEEIVCLLECDYPSADYVYNIERAIPGTRFYPDVLITTRSGHMVCVVEIGYTRPEKLTHYRDVLKIQDVRWYDKAGTLHPGWQTQSLRATVQVVGAEPEEVAVYDLVGRVDCNDCLVYWACPDYCGECDDCKSYAGATWAVLITDYIRWWLPTYCDECARRWFNDDEGIVDELRYLTRSEFGREYGARQLVGWPEAVAYVARAFDLKLSALDGDRVDGGGSVAQGLDAEIRRAARVQSVEIVDD